MEAEAEFTVDTLLDAVTDAALLDLKARIEAWRESRVKLRPMPKALWQAAVRLAKKYGVNQVSKTLGINYSDLKRKLDGNGGPRGKKSKSPLFVDLTPPASTCSKNKQAITGSNPMGALNFSPPSAVFSPARLELSRPDGTKLLVENADQSLLLQAVRLLLEDLR